MTWFNNIYFPQSSEKIVTTIQNKAWCLLVDLNFNYLFQFIGLFISFKAAQQSSIFWIFIFLVSDTSWILRSSTGLLGFFFLTVKLFSLLLRFSFIKMEEIMSSVKKLTSFAKHTNVLTNGFHLGWSLTFLLTHLFYVKIFGLSVPLVVVVVAAEYFSVMMIFCIARQGQTGNLRYLVSFDL